VAQLDEDISANKALCLDVYTSLNVLTACDDVLPVDPGTVTQQTQRCFQLRLLKPRCSL